MKDLINSIFNVDENKFLIYTHPLFWTIVIIAILYYLLSYPLIKLYRWLMIENYYTYWFRMSNLTKRERKEFLKNIDYVLDNKRQSRARRKLWLKAKEKLKQ